MKNEIINKKKGKVHGYQQWYYYDLLYCRCNFAHDKETGYAELHMVKETYYYII